MNIDLLTKAIENTKNTSFADLSTIKIKNEKNDILQKLNQPRNNLKEFNSKLKNYRFIGELNQLNEGSYLRWINISNPSYIKLTNGGILCEIKIEEKGPIIVCKNKFNQFFQFNFDLCLVFQRLNDQEKILLSAFDYLQK